MATDIDTLQIQINAQATKANDAIDRLVGKIDRLQKALGSLDGSKLSDLANGVKALSSAMEHINGIKTSDFTGLAKNIEKLKNIDTSGLRQVSTDISQISTSLSNLNDLSSGSGQMKELADSVKELGGSTVTKAIANIPKLSTAMSQLMSELSKAPAVSQNLIDMTNALANLTAQGEKVGTASKSLVSGLNNSNSAAKKTKKTFKGLASAIGTFYANFGLAIRGIKKIGSSIGSTADYLEAYNYFDVALSKVGKDWSGQYEQYGYENAESYEKSFSTRLSEKLSGLSGLKLEIGADGETGILSDSGLKNLGLNISEVTQYASQLASVTNSVGQTGEVTLAAASAFTKLGADMSSLFNADYSSVMNNLQSGLIGQSRALYKYGIDITNATLQTYAYDLGVEKAVSEMTQAEKMQLRMIAILDQSRVSWGDQSNTINSLSNSIRQFKNNLSEAGQVLGQLFVPLMEKLMPIINGVTIAIKRLMVSIASLFGVKLSITDAGQAAYDYADGMEEVAGAYDDATSAAKKFKTQSLGIDELNVLSPQEDTGSGSSGAGGGLDLTDEILKATEEYEKAWQEAYDNMVNQAEAFADRIEKALEPVKKIFEDIKIGDWFAVGEDTSNLVASIFNFFAKAIDEVDWYGIGTKIGDFLSGIEWTAVFASVGSFMWQGLKAAFELAMGSFESAPLETAIIGVLASPAIVGFGSKIYNLIVKPVIEGWNSIEPVLSLITQAINPITIGIAVLAVGLWNAYTKNEEVRESFANATQAIRDGFQPAVEFITNTLLPDLQAGWERLKEILSPFTDFLNDMFVSIWQDMINPALTYIGETVLPEVTGAFENLWNNVLVPLASFLASVLQPAVKLVSYVLQILWKNVVVPLASALGNILGKAFEGIVSIFNELVIPKAKLVISTFQFLWTNVFLPIATYLVEKFKPTFENVFTVIGGLIDGLGTALGGLIDFVVGVFTQNWKKAWDGVKEIFKGVFNGIISIAEGAINQIINGINGFLKGFDDIVSGVGDVIGLDIHIPTIPRVELPRFEVGGFPEDGLFLANHTELVGQFSNGKTAVANNEQIIAGIQQGVYEANSEQNDLMREMIGLLQDIRAKDTTIKMSGRDVGKGINTANRRSGYKLGTAY